MAEIRTKFGSGLLGDRRTKLGTPPPVVDFSTDAFVEREAITVILTEKGWIRAIKGAVADPDELKFKEGDRLRLLLPCQTTDRLTLFATNGRAFTLKAAELPLSGVRGDGQAVRLLAELTNEDAVVALFVAVEAGAIRTLHTGRGFVVAGSEFAAERRTGKILNLKPDEEAVLCVPADGDHVAVIGENRRLLVRLEQVPEMARGAGVILQPTRMAVCLTQRSFASPTV